MKHLSLYLLGGFLIIGLVGGYLFFQSNKILDESLLQTASSQSLFVTPLNAQVQLASASSPEVFTEIQTSTAAQSGARVKTSATGRALIEGVNTTVIDSNTELTLSTVDPEKNQTLLRVEAGRVWSRIKKLSDKGEFYEIETQNARASVRGTSFGFERKGNITTIIVVEGNVRFGAIPPDTDESIQYSVANVGAGKKAVYKDGDDVPVVTDLTDADRQDAWYIFNNTSLVDQAQGIMPSKDTSVSNAATTSSAPSNSPVSNDGSVSVVVPPLETPTSSAPSQGSAPSSGTSVQVAPEIVPAPVPVSSGDKTISPGIAGSPELILSSLVPNVIVENFTPRFTIRGSGFSSADISSVYVGDTMMSQFSVVDDASIMVTVPIRTILLGTYDVSVVGRSGISASLPNSLTVVPLR